MLKICLTQPPHFFQGPGSRCPAHATTRWGTRKGGYRGDWPKLSRQVRLEEPRCRACGAPTRVADHIRPKAEGGTDERHNLQGLCKGCHAKKTTEEGHRGMKRRSR